MGRQTHSTTEVGLPSPSSFGEEGGDYVLMRLDDVVESPYIPKNIDEEGHGYGEVVLAPRREEQNEGYEKE